MAECGTGPPTRAHGASLWILLAVLGVLCVLVLRPFLSPLLWAAIVAYASWPLYRHVRRLCRGRDSVAAIIMTALVSLVLVVPFVWLAILLTDEVSRAYQGLMAYRDAGTMVLPPFVRDLPWAGDVMQRAVDQYSADPVLIRTLLIDWVQRLHVELLEMASGIGRNAMKLLTMIVSIFFFYRDGEGLARQASRVIDRFFARRLARYLEAAGAMLKADRRHVPGLGTGQPLARGDGTRVVGVGTVRVGPGCRAPVGQHTAAAADQHVHAFAVPAGDGRSRRRAGRTWAGRAHHRAGRARGRHRGLARMG